jgi:hypothetical protein
VSGAGIVVGLLGGGVVGTVASGFIGAAVQRAERTRERLVECANEMLEAVSGAQTALLAHRRRTAELFVATQNLTHAQTGLQESVAAATAGQNTAAIAAAQRIAAGLPDWEEVTSGAFDERIDPEILSEALEAIRQSRGRLSTERHNLPDDLSAAIKAVLDAWRAFVPAASEQRGTWRDWAAAYSTLGVVLSRVILLFTFKERDSAVVAATAASNAFGNVAQLVHSEQAAGRNPNIGNEAVDGAVGVMANAVGDFARAANADIRRWWL